MSSYDLSLLLLYLFFFTAASLLLFICKMVFILVYSKTLFSLHLYSRCLLLRAIHNQQWF